MAIVFCSHALSVTSTREGVGVLVEQS